MKIKICMGSYVWRFVTPMFRLLPQNFWFELKIEKAKVETITEVVSRLDALSARGKSTVVCRVRRSYREGDPTWIDIANDRKLWTSLVYELFHDAKNY